MSIDGDQPGAHPDPEERGPAWLLPDAILRYARHHADLSQRELAYLAGVDRSVVARIESGSVRSPGYVTMMRLLAACRCRLLAVDCTGTSLRPRPHDDALDSGLRRWPSHLDVRRVHSENDWWYGWYRFMDMRPLPEFTADWRRSWGPLRILLASMSTRLGPVTRIALVGDREERSQSHREVDAVITMLGEHVGAEWVATDGDQVQDLSGFDAIWLMPGSPYRNDAAAFAAITFARTRGVPFLGTCGGLQYAVVEYFRTVLGVAEASHAEVDGPGDTNVVTAMACSLAGREREVVPVPGTAFAAIVSEPFIGMHYCSYAPSGAALTQLTQAGWVIGATADDAGAEVLLLPEHPFFVLSLFQPQVGALAGKPLHPLLREFVRIAQHAAA